MIRRALLAATLLLACERRQAPEMSQVEAVRPVYPVEGVQPDPRAEKLCAALQGLPEDRRAACCASSPGVTLAGECARMLSAALAARAVTLDAAAVDACAAARAGSLAGCDWVGPFPPPPPAACLGLVRGTLPRGAGCRSSLECQGELRCLGVGPTAAGRCGPARAAGEACGAAVDALGAMLQVPDLDETHPECEGSCAQARCAPAAALGAACTHPAACGRGRHCAAGRCVDGARARAGEACTAGGCETGTRCWKGTCVAPRAEGEACESDFECKGACAEGKCRHDCARR
jgi:hypothetical protein